MQMAMVRRKCSSPKSDTLAASLNRKPCLYRMGARLEPLVGGRIMPATKTGGQQRPTCSQSQCAGDVVIWPQKGQRIGRPRRPTCRRCGEDLQHDKHWLQVHTQQRSPDMDGVGGLTD